MDCFISLVTEHNPSTIVFVPRRTNILNYETCLEMSLTHNTYLLKNNKHNHSENELKLIRQKLRNIIKFSFREDVEYESIDYSLFINLKHIEVNNDVTEKFIEFISPLEQIKELSIELPKPEINLSNLIHIRKIQLCGTYTQKPCIIPNSIFTLTNLTEMSISVKLYNYDLFYTFPNLEKLEILNRSLKTFPKSILGLTKLKYLKINSYINEIPDEIINLQELEYFYIEFHHGIKVSDNYLKLPKLKELVYDDKYLGEFKPVSDNLVKLILQYVKKPINLDYVYKQKNLTEFTMFCCASNNICDDIEKLTKLRVLRISQCTGIYSISYKVNKLKDLRIIDISHTKIQDINIYGLNNLEFLSLLETKQYSVPSGIETLTSLKVLVLVGCDIYELPEEIYNLPNLQILDLSKNNVPEIGDSIKKLTKLTKLFMGDNQITKVSKNIDELKQLKVINLSRNKLTSFYDDIDLPNLEILSIDDNPLTKIPVPIFCTNLSLFIIGHKTEAARKFNVEDYEYILKSEFLKFVLKNNRDDFIPEDIEYDRFYNLNSHYNYY